MVIDWQRSGNDYIAALDGYSFEVFKKGKWKWYVFKENKDVDHGKSKTLELAKEAAKKAYEKHL